MPEETVTISKTEYDKIQEQLKWLYALESAGVDNWQGIEEAINIMNGDMG